MQLSYRFSIRVCYFSSFSYRPSSKGINHKDMLLHIEKIETSFHLFYFCSKVAPVVKMVDCIIC
uniref:Uncharacterized protein n=1 Tax=Lepeophtheirus salmonis TaxID=72036 RepID=A0A0K2T304_LEPSM